MVKLFGVPMSASFPPLLHAGISNQIAHRPLDRPPRRSRQDALAMREIHSLEDVDKAIEERAKSEFGDRVEIGERAHTTKKNCCGLRVVVQRPCEISPLNSESMDRRLPAFFGLLSDLS